MSISVALLRSNALIKKGLRPVGCRPDTIYELRSNALIKKGLRQFNCIHFNKSYKLRSNALIKKGLRPTVTTNNVFWPKIQRPD